MKGVKEEFSKRVYENLMKPMIQWVKIIEDSSKDKEKGPRGG
jgi:hypothetical protein